MSRHQALCAGALAAAMLFGACSPARTANGKAGFEPYSDAKVAEARRQNRPVVVLATAEW